MLKYWSTPKRILSVEALSILIKFVSILNYSSMGWFFCILNDFSRGWWKSSFLSHWSLFRHQEGKYYSMTSNPAQPELSLICQRILYQSLNFQLGGKPFQSRPRPSCRRMCCWGFIHIPFHISTVFHVLHSIFLSKPLVVLFAQHHKNLPFLILLKIAYCKGPALTWLSTPATQTHHPVVVTFQDCQLKLCQWSSSPPQIL